MIARLKLFTFSAILVLSSGVHTVGIAQFGKCESAGAAQHKETTARSLFIPMRDGVKIAADLFLPKDLAAGARIPTVLTLTRYWRATEGQPPNSMQRFFTGHGYAVVSVDVRGTGASFGRWPYPWSADEIKDDRDIVNWIVAEPWSDGKVGTIGTSYTANTAEYVAIVNHPAVKAVIPRFSDFDVYLNLAYPGGIMTDYFLREWQKAVHDMDKNVKGGQPPRGVKSVDDDKDRRLLEDAVKSHANNPDVYEAAKEITFRDDRPKSWGASMDDFSTHSFRKEIERSKVAIFSWGGWLDAGTSEGVLARFMTFSNPQRAVIGAWSHGAGHHASPYLPPSAAVDPDPAAQRSQYLCYFDHYLKGAANGMGERVLIYYTMGEEKWKATKVWPPAGSRTERWYLAADNSLSKQSPTTQTASDKYTVNFEATTGTNNRWYTQMGGGDVIYPDRAEEDRKLLTYTSAPLTEDKEITGHVVITLYVTSTAADGAFYVYLEDVDESGRVTYLTEGQLRAIHRKISRDERPYKSLMPYHSFKRKDALPLVPGEVTELKFGLWPTSVLIKKGHRVRIAIAGADKDTFARIPAEGTPEITVARNSRHASFIELPVIERR